MEKETKKRKSWSLQEVVLLAFIAFIFGAVFMLGGYLYAPLATALGAYGYEPFAGAILFGIWTIAAPVSAMIIKRPGTAIIGEIFAALAEMLYGSFWGASVLIMGFVQGLGSELGFTFTKYKRYDALPLWIGAAGTAILTYTYEYFKYGYYEFSTLLVIELFVVHCLSSIVFNVFLVQAIMKIYNGIEASLESRHNEE